MKKLLFIFSLLLFFMFISFPKTNASTVNTIEQYVEENIGNDDMLIEEDLRIVSGVVDWSKCGTYLVTYADSNANLYYKNVHIIEKTKEYIFKDYPEQIVNIPKNHNVVDIKNINDNSFFLISNYEEADPTDYDQEKACIAYYENGVFKWEYHYFKYSRYVTSCLYNDHLIVSALVYNHDKDSENSILLFEITPDRKIYKEREITTNKSCYNYGINVIDNYVYLITATSGVTNDYKDINIDGEYKPIILKLTYQNFEIVSSKVIDIPSFNIVDTYFYLDKISLHIKLNSPLTNNNQEYKHLIYQIDSHFKNEEINYFNLNYNEDYLGYGIGNNIVFYLVKDSTSLIRIQYIQKEAIIKQTYLSKMSDNIANNCHIVRVVNDDIYLALTNNNQSKKEFLGYSLIKYGSDPLYFYNEKINTLVFKINFYKDKIYETYYLNNVLYTKRVDLITFIKEEIKEKDYTLERKKVIFNTNELTKVSNNPNISNFGKYRINSLYIDENNTKYNLLETYTVNLCVNVEDNSIYQKGKILELNGVASLNGIPIESGFKVNDIGKYLLVITGANHQQVALNFEIKNLNVENEERIESNLNIVKDNIYKEVIKNEANINNNVEMIKVNATNMDVLSLCLSIILLTILSFIFLRKKI